MVERKRYLDIMKFIGVCCLFFAHVQGPYILEEIRGFDVPMMVIISGVLAVPSIKKAPSAKDYIIKRIKRLVIPAWIFLSIFYMAMFVVGQKAQMSDIVKSFLFQRDCGLAGGVWIIWVYLVCAVIGPGLYKVILKKWFIPILIIALLLNEWSLCLAPSLIEIRVLYYSVFTVIPYGAMFSLGMYLPKLNQKTKWILSSFVLLFHIIAGIWIFIQNGNYITISQYKYPARLYYLSYGFSITIILIEIMTCIESKIPNFRVIRFVSENSLWIYLWQIMMLAIVNYILKISQYWLLSWICLMVGSVFITWIQYSVIKWLEKQTNWSFLKYFRG